MDTTFAKKEPPGIKSFIVSFYHSSFYYYRACRYNSRGPNKYNRSWEYEHSRPRGRGGIAPRGGPSERGSGFERNPESRPRSQRQEMPKF